jgi:hypothetical protein
MEFQRKLKSEVKPEVRPAILLLWSRSTGGYEWRRAGKDFNYYQPGPPEPRLTPLHPDETVLVLRSGQDPIEQYQLPAELFLKFASLNPELEELNSFANEFGFLGLDDGSNGHVVGKRDGRVLYGEAFSVWRKEIADMKFVLEVKEMIQDARAGDREPLKKRVQWVKHDLGPAFRIRRQPGDTGGQYIFAPRSIADARSGTFGRWNENSYVDAAIEFLRQEIGKHGRLRPHILWDLSYRDPLWRTGDLIRHLLPDSLLAGLWWQLGEAIERNRTIARCENDNCRKMMSISASGEGTRAGRRTCSDKCRQERWRRNNLKPERRSTRGRRRELSK